MAVSTASSRYSLPASSVKILPEHRMSRSTESALSLRLLVVEHGLEGALGELLERRGGHRVPEEALGRHDDQGTLVVLERGLGAQQVEVLGRRREVGDAHVLVRGELEVALQAGAGVLGSLALVAVRQEQHEPRGLAPLRLAARR